MALIADCGRPFIPLARSSPEDEIDTEARQLPGGHGLQRICFMNESPPTQKCVIIPRSTSAPVQLLRDYKGFSQVFLHFGNSATERIKTLENVIFRITIW